MPAGATETLRCFRLFQAAACFQMGITLNRDEDKASP
jgi:hypothetical protein